MYCIFLNLSLLEFVIVPAGIVILGCAVYLFYTTRKSLRQTLEAYGATALQQPEKKPARRMFAKAEPQVRAVAGNMKKANVSWPEPLSVSENAMPPVSELKETLRMQQQTLISLMQRVEDLQGDAEGAQAYKEENDGLQARIEEMELALMRKDQELAQARQQETIAQQMANRIDEVYKEFDLLQHKISTLEAQAAKATSLSLELNDLQQSYQHLQKDAVRKQLRMEELMAENQRLRAGLDIAESRVAEASVQQQQLTKRNQFLKETHSSEMQHFTDNNGKLQKELRRIGELESMLSLMAEERARLLDKNKK